MINDTRSPSILRKAAFQLPFFLLAGMVEVNSAMAATETLELISPWQVERHAESCALSAAFGNQRNPLVLHFERFEPYHDFQLLMVGKQLKRLVPPTKLSIAYGSTGKVQTTASYRQARNADGTPAILVPVAGLPHDGESTQAVAAGEAAVDHLTLTIGQKRQVIVNTGSLGEPFAAFTTCTDQLVSSWGYEPGHKQSLSRRLSPLSNPSSWLRPADYPGAALFSRAQGMVNFRLDVDAAGTPLRCKVQRSFGDEFDSTTCSRLMERARFRPALNAAGQPVASYYVNRAYFLIP